MNEPTSYGLQPPQVPARQGPVEEVEAGEQQEARPYEPTRAVTLPDTAGTEKVPLLAGRYRLGDRLGHGGMGTVWQAHDEVVDRPVAIKEPRVPDNLSPQERETVFLRMRREARAAARIDHPSVVTIHDVVVEDGRPWIVMELVNGRSLGHVLTEGTLSGREAARIGLAVLGALAAAHEAGILHRDVKPDNVLLGRHERVVLTDFGIAHMEGEQRLTETGSFVGSPEFIAPERVLGQRPGPESDLWSLGVVLYAALEGVSPFRRSNTPATLQAVLSAEPQTPTRATGGLGAVIMQLMRKDPGMRPAAVQLKRALEEAARPAPVGSVPSRVSGGGTGRTARIGRMFGGRGRRVWWGFAGALAVALATLLVWANLFADGGLPDGWKRHDETERVRATLAVPGEFRRSAGEDDVSYEGPGGVYSVYVSRAVGIEDSVLEEANGWKDYYEDGAEENYLETMVEIDSRVTEVLHQGHDAAQVITTWRDPDSDDEDGAGEVVHRRRELFLVNDDGVRWRLYVDMPAAEKHRAGGDDIYEHVKESLRVEGL